MKILHALGEVVEATGGCGHAAAKNSPELAAQHSKEMQRPALDGHTEILKRFHGIVAAVWNGSGVPQKWKEFIKVLHKNKYQTECRYYREFPW